MPPPDYRPRANPPPGLSRSALRDRPAAPRAPGRVPGRAPAVAPAPPEPVRSLHAGKPAVPRSVMGDFLQIVGGVALSLVALVGLLFVVYKMRDSLAVGNYIAEAKAQRTTLVCQDGRMVRGDGSLRDVLLADAYFVCTDWKTIQSIELEESKGK